MSVPRVPGLVGLCLAVALVAGCSTASPSAPLPAHPTAAPTLGGPAGTGAGSGPGGPLATPLVVDGLSDPTALQPPVLETGDVPAPADPTAPIRGHLTLGATADLATQTVGPAGGAVGAQGFEIRVPDGALASDTAFKVGQAPITGQDFGDLITPLTPLYLVDDGDANLLAPVTIVLPATIPDGRTAMAFAYDDVAGSLSPLLPIAQDARSLTVGATHFSGLFGALVDVAKLPETADSGFRPGIDDWQFTNYGSYVAPGGQCEGQSVSAIWYYLDQRRGSGASPLFGLYDNNGAPTKTPTLWQDDSDGYRFVASVHADPIAVPFTYGFLRNAMWDSADGRFTYQAFRAAIAFSGAPQLIRISPAPGDPGHTMIAYRVTPDRIFVADPNYPGQLRTIRYDAATGTLGPYSSGSNAADIAADGATVYTRIAYVPWQSSKSEAGVAAHWAEFQAGTAGDAVFPTYTLQVLAGKDAQGRDVWAPLVDGYQSTEKTLTLRLRDRTRTDQTRMEVHRDTSSTVLAAGRQVTFELEDGENPLGITELGAKPDWTDWAYVDFVRLTVIRVEEGGWKLVGAGTEVRRVQDPWNTWDLTGSPGSLTSKLTAHDSTARPPAGPVSFSWSAPTTLIPFADRGSIASPKPSDGYLAIGPAIRLLGPPDSKARDVATAYMDAFLVVGPDPPPPDYPAATTLAYLKEGGTFITEQDQLEVPSFVPGSRLYLEVQVRHELALIVYQYVYEWAGPQ